MPFYYNERNFEQNPQKKHRIQISMIYVRVCNNCNVPGYNYYYYICLFHYHNALAHIKHKTKPETMKF